MRLPWLMFFLLISRAFGAGPASVSPWPAIESDLPPMASLRQPVLPNGVRVFILPNAEPKGHVSLRLMIAAGSLVENYNELGLAHFVEHMAFRSTRSHPDGTLIPTLERLGVGFGPDSAAFTSYDHTIYHLDLPRATEEALRQGLEVLREFATEVTFEPGAIDRERGVIFSEAEFRDTPIARQELANQGFLWPVSRQIFRQPIGNAELCREFTRDQFVAFYDAWYRPERMVLIVVGDVDPAMAQRVTAQMFGAFGPRAPARPDPVDLIPPRAASPNISVFSEPGIAGCELLLEHPEPHPHRPDTHAERVRDLDLSLAMAMFQRRLLRLSLDPRSTFVSPIASYSDDMPGWRLVETGTSSRIADWKKVAADLEQEHRRAFTYGFTIPEMNEARAVFAARYAEAARTFPTWSSEWIANQLAIAIRTGRAFIDPAVAQRDIASDLAAATPEDCRREFRAVWTTHAQHVFVAANPAFQVTAPEIAATLNESRKIKVDRPRERPVEPFAYRSFGPPGTLVKNDYLADLDLRLTAFANGVRFNFKSTTFASDTVDVHVRVGEGRLGQPEDEPGLDLFANSMLLAGGVGRHSIDALSDILAVTTVRPDFHVESDACVFTATCSRRDLGLCLDLIAAFLTDAAYRPDALRTTEGGFGTMYTSLWASPSGPIVSRAGRMLADGDRRFGVPDPDAIRQRNIVEMRKWLEPQFRRGAIEVSLVGDVGWSEAMPLVAATLGALPARIPRREFAAAKALKPPRPAIAPAVFSANPQLKQCGIAWYWPVAGGGDTRQERRYFLLAGILQERLRIRLREQLGATYTPTATFEENYGFPEMNWITCQAEVDSSQETNAMQLIGREAMSLSLEGPTEEEFERAKQVFVRMMSDDLRTNSYWGVTVLSDAQEHPDRIAAARNRAGDLVALSRGEVANQAACLDPGNSFRFISTPYFTPQPSLAVPSQPFGSISIPRK